MAQRHADLRTNLLIENLLEITHLAHFLPIHFIEGVTLFQKWKIVGNPCLVLNKFQINGLPGWLIVAGRGN